MPVTPDDIVVNRDYPSSRIGVSANAREEIEKFVFDKWSEGSYTDQVRDILDLFEKADGSYGVVEFVTFVVSGSYREVFFSVHQLDSHQSRFTGFEREDGVLDLGVFTENLLKDTEILSEW